MLSTRGGILMMIGISAISAIITLNQTLNASASNTNASTPMSSFSQISSSTTEISKERSTHFLSLCLN